MVVQSFIFNQLHLRVGDQWNPFRGDTVFVLYGSGIHPTTTGERWLVSGLFRTSVMQAPPMLSPYHVPVGFSTLVFQLVSQRATYPLA